MQKSRVDLKALRDSLFPDNTVGAVQPSTLRNFLDYLIDSDFNLTDDTVAPGEIQHITVTIPSASILTGNSAPFELIPAPGAGKIINVLSAVSKIIFGTVAYATNPNYNIRYNLTTATLFQTSALNYSQTKYNVETRDAPGGLNAADIENTSIVFFVQTGNPTAGDGTITISLQYIIETI